VATECSLQLGSAVAAVVCLRKGPYIVTIMLMSVKWYLGGGEEQKLLRYTDPCSGRIHLYA
jgi:hypothetical protein